MEVDPVDEEKIIVQFKLVERRIFSSIDLSGNYSIPDEKILGAAGFQQGSEFTEELWERALNRIASLYRQEGFFQARFSSRFQPALDNRREIGVVLEIDEGNRARIRNLSFDGEKVFSDLTLLFRVRSHEKEYYRFEVLEKDLDRIRRLYEKEGYFKAVVGPPVVTFVEESSGVDITIPIDSSNKIEIIFEGNLRFARDKLEQRLLIKEERSDADDILEESARRIEAYYRRKGFPFARVTSFSRRFPEQNRMEAHFKIESGFRAEIRDITFTGRHAFSETRLKELIQLEEEAFWTESRYTERAIEEDTAALTAFYRKEGFQNARVSSKTEWDPSKRFATIQFNIDEGVRTRVDAVEIEGNQAFSSEELKKRLSIQSQAPYHDSTVKEGARQLLSAYSKAGYLDAEVIPSVRFSEDRTAAVLRYHVTEGDQIRFGDIELRGNLQTRDPVLLRELLIKKGEPYDPEKLLRSQRELYRTGHFSVVHFDPIRSPEDPTIQDVRLTVVERPSVALEFGFGYADRERLSGFFEIANRNLFGTGREISARAQASRIEKKYALNYKEPWMFSQKIDARLAAAYLDLKEEAFDLKTTSGTVGFDKSFSDTIKASLLYQYEHNDIANVDPAAVRTAEDIGRVRIASINPSIIRDTRDDPFNPRGGSVNGIAFRNAARMLGSEAQLFKVTLQSSWYHTLGPRFVFAFSTRAGVANRFGETDLVPLPERFFLGGRSTVRGYEQDRLGIEGATLSQGEPIGGNAMLVFNEELRIALPRSLGLVFFFDHGNVWPEYRDVSFSEIKSTTGIGLRYNTPIGPLRVDWGYKLNREAEEDPWAFHFTLGHAF